VVVFLAGCVGTGSRSAPPVPADYEITGRYPGACGWLRVDADGNRRRTDRTYEGIRLMAEVTYDEAGTTRLIRARRWEYDAQGNAVLVESVDGAERRAERLAEQRHDRLVTEVVSNGAVVRRHEQYFDAQGNVTARRTVRASDGKVLRIQTYERDTSGAVVRERIDFPLEGRTEKIELAHHDGNLERHRRRSPGDELHQRDVYAFGPSGRLQQMTRYGDVRLTQRYRHDDSGNLLRVDTWDEDGEPIAATVYDYGCWAKL
jgi:hypothetical protein